jgi:hypothetical protein
MTDPYKTKPFEDRQSKAIRDDAKFSRQPKVTEGEGTQKKKRVKSRVSQLYQAGIDLFSSHNIFLELCEEGQHVHHRIFIPDKAKTIEGIVYPDGFQPLREISSIKDFEIIESTLLRAVDEDVRDFWQPLIYPKAGDSDLQSFSERKLHMASVQQKREIYDVLDYQQTFDPTGSLTGQGEALNPKTWVPAREWFNPVLHQVKFEDVFTIFPQAECQLLKLLLGRIGVGRTGHLPPGFKDPVVHTARMAAVIVGSDPGLGKSTLFNQMIAAFAQTGFTSSTFKSTDDRFGLGRTAMADVAYKDDTSMASLKKFLASENTKILVTNGKLETEEKFQSAQEVNPRCVLIVNSNDWCPELCYDLDPGIRDRIKLISTYKEVEVMKRIGIEPSPLIVDSPDLRPFSHLPWLANKLGVSIDALFLWCLRLATDYFWSIITDNSDPTINRLQVEVRHWTTRLRIKFKSEMSMAFMSACILSTMLRSNGGWIPKEMNYQALADAIQDFWFIGIDPSGVLLMDELKQDWEDSGRVTTHPYQAFREIRWESVTDAITIIGTQHGLKTVNDRDKTSKVLRMMSLRDGFSLNTGYSFAISSWQSALFATSTLYDIRDRCLSVCDEWDLSRIKNKDLYPEPDRSWMEKDRYDPKFAEELRKDRRAQLCDNSN